MNDINVKRSGEGIQMRFDPALLDEINEERIIGFRPVIIHLTPIPSIFPILGLVDEPVDEEPIEVSDRLEPFDRRRILEQALL